VIGYHFPALACCDLERARFLSPSYLAGFPFSPTLRLSALALFGSAASGDPIIRERDLGSRLSSAFTI
jgi:hypothetical protein